jgi:hypothetical protein
MRGLWIGGGIDRSTSMISGFGIASCLISSHMHICPWYFAVSCQRRHCCSAILDCAIPIWLWGCTRPCETDDVEYLTNFARRRERLLQAQTRECVNMARLPRTLRYCNLQVAMILVMTLLLEHSEKPALELAYNDLVCMQIAILRRRTSPRSSKSIYYQYNALISESTSSYCN